jgi:hypothetical protein
MSSARHSRRLGSTGPGNVCVCGDPISEHSDEEAHYCLRWDCGCTRCTTPEEMEALKREHSLQ